MFSGYLNNGSGLNSNDFNILLIVLDKKKEELLTKDYIELSDDIFKIIEKRQIVSSFNNMKEEIDLNKKGIVSYYPNGKIKDYKFRIVEKVEDVPLSEDIRIYFGTRFLLDLRSHLSNNRNYHIKNE